MLSFASGLSPNSDAFVIFVTEKYEYKDKSNILSKELTQKIDSFLKSLKVKNEKEAAIEFMKLKSKEINLK